MDEGIAAVLCVLIVAVVVLVIVVRWQNTKAATATAEAEARKWEAMTKLTDNIPDMTPAPQPPSR
jgi:large-conductance mechanosensitive channel